MSKPPKPSPKARYEGASSEAEKERRAKALRKNLLRRKAAPASSKKS